MSTPDNILARVRALLAKAEATEFPAEAEALSEKASELMARYGIDQAMADARADVSQKPASRIFDIDNPWGQVKAHLLAGIAGALGCQCVMLTSKSGPAARIHVFGFAADIEQVDMLYTSLVLQMAHAHSRVAVPMGVRSVRAWNRSWLLGWVTAVIGRAKLAYAKAKADADAASTSGPSTELVLSDRSLAVKSALREAYPIIRSTRLTYSGRGYGDGHAAGQKANIHDRSGVGSGRAALSR